MHFSMQFYTLVLVIFTVYELSRSNQTSMIIETFRSVDLHQSKLNSDIAQLNVM